MRSSTATLTAPARHACAGRHDILHVTEHHLSHELERVLVWIALALDHAGGR